jgi:hypothetical protein
MSSHHSKSRPAALLFALALGATYACSSGGGAGGCPGMTPIPSGRYLGPKTDNSMNIRLSGQGIQYLNSNWQSLLETFAPGQVITVPMPCAVQRVGSGSIGVDMVIADQGGVGCTAESCGRMDGRCDFRDAPASVPIQITAMQLVPVAPDRIQVSVTASIRTGKIYTSSVDRSLAMCSWLSPIKCSLEYDTTFNGPTTNSMAVAIKFSIDTKWDKLMSFSVESLVGTQVCGSSGAPPPPSCLDARDIDIDGENNCGSVYCGTFDWEPIKEFILKTISPYIQDTIRSTINQQACEKCGAGLPTCPQLPGASSVCQNQLCTDTATGKCVPKLLGVEGRLWTGVAMSGFGVPADAQLDLSVAAGSTVSVDTGINMGTRAGMKAGAVASCVPTLLAPPIPAVPAPDFDANADPAKGPYHVGIGISKAFMDLAMHEAHQSGTLCIAMTSANVGMLNTGLFKTFLPSLGKVATRDGKDAPMMITLRPPKAPFIRVGEGTYDPITKKPIKPLINLTLPELTIDFYAMFDDRYARLFTIIADISMPLSLIFDGCSSVTPALGDLKQLVTNVRTSNSEILAEDPQVLADLIPAVMGMAEPALASALQPFAMPALGGFKLKVNDAKGLTKIAGSEDYHHLGLYAQLLPANAQCANLAPRLTASLKRTVMPEASQMRATGRSLPIPVAVLEVHAAGMAGPFEYSYRVDGGMWTPFEAPNGLGELEAAHPRFLFQGSHTIEVRARAAEQPQGLSPPVEVGVVIDWEPPEVLLRADRANNLVTVSARDAVSGPQALQYAYRVGQGALSAFGPPRLVALDAIEDAGGLEVQVMDEAGLIGRGVYRVPTVAERADEPLSDGESVELAASPGAGCSAGGGALGLWALLGLAGHLWRGRRARS